MNANERTEHRGGDDAHGGSAEERGREPDPVSEALKNAGLESTARDARLLHAARIVAAREIVLPDKREKMVEKMLDALLESVRDGFPDGEVRKRALAKLAFEIRTRGGAAEIARDEAEAIIEAYLRDPVEGPGWNEESAREGARTLARASKEGLLVRGKDGELRLRHDALEAHLAGLEVATWTLEAQTRFAREHAGETRWDGAISAMLASMRRRHEVGAMRDTIRAARRGETTTMSQAETVTVQPEGKPPVRFTGTRRAQHRCRHRSVDVHETASGWIVTTYHNALNQRTLVTRDRAPAHESDHAELEMLDGKRSTLESAAAHAVVREAYAKAGILIERVIEGARAQAPDKVEMMARTGGENARGVAHFAPVRFEGQRLARRTESEGARATERTLYRLASGHLLVASEPRSGEHEGLAEIEVYGSAHEAIRGQQYHPEVVALCEAAGLDTTWEIE